MGIIGHKNVSCRSIIHYHMDHISFEVQSSSTNYLRYIYIFINGHINYYIRCVICVALYVCAIVVADTLSSGSFRLVVTVAFRRSLGRLWAKKRSFCFVYIITLIIIIYDYLTYLPSLLSLLFPHNIRSILILNVKRVHSAWSSRLRFVGP